MSANYRQTDDGSELTAAIATNYRRHPSPAYLSIQMCEVCGYRPAETMLVGQHTPVCSDCWSDKMHDIHRPGKVSFALLLALSIVFALCGYWFGRYSVQSANELITAGFVIVDPEGYEIESFDDGPAAAVEYMSAVWFADDDNPFKEL